MLRRTLVGRAPAAAAAVLPYGVRALPGGGGLEVTSLRTAPGVRLAWRVGQTRGQERVSQ